MIPAGTLPESQIWTRTLGEGPLVAVALHHGHDLRPEVRDFVQLSDEQRLREEDPFTGDWTTIAPTRFVVSRSRFEVDLNRPREIAVYQTAEDAWGLDVWREQLSTELVDRSLAQYDAFYDELKQVLVSLEREFGYFVVFDLHSYNHRRKGPDAPAEDAQQNPQVNVGTGTMNRKLWAPVVDAFISSLSKADFPGGKLDVRENVRFKGGYLARWVHETFPTTGCVLAVEFKKFFMDEWTGTPKADLLRAVPEALKSTIAPVNTALKQVHKPKRTRKAMSRDATRRSIRIGFIVNDVMTERAGYTTIRLAMIARQMGHEAWLMGVGDLAYDADEKIHARAFTVPKQVYKTSASFLRDLTGNAAIKERIVVDDLDILMLRNDPSTDAIARPWAAQAGILFGRVATRRGTVVLNDPNGLAKATNKMYFQSFPEEVRPTTIITRDRDDIRAFARDRGTIVMNRYKAPADKGSS